MKKDDMIADEMEDYIQDNDIYYICDLWHQAETKRSEDWFPVLRNRKMYYHFKVLLESRRRIQRSKGLKVPPPKYGFDYLEQTISERV